MFEGSPENSLRISNENLADLLRRGEADGEDGHALRAGGADGPAVEPDDLPGDGQPQARAAGAGGIAFL